MKEKSKGVEEKNKKGWKRGVMEGVNGAEEGSKGSREKVRRESKMRGTK